MLSAQSCKSLKKSQRYNKLSLHLSVLVLAQLTCSLSSSIVFSAIFISSCSFSFWHLSVSSSKFFFSICFCCFAYSCFSDADKSRILMHRAIDIIIFTEHHQMKPHQLNIGTEHRLTSPKPLSVEHSAPLTALYGN